MQDWAKQLDYQERQRQKREEEEKARKEGRVRPDEQPTGKGFLSLTSKVDLNSMDVDLSEQLRVRKKSGSEASSSSRSGGASGAQQAQQRRRPPVKYGRDPPTRVEQRSWERSGKYSRKVVATAPTNEADQVGRWGEWVSGLGAALSGGAGWQLRNLGLERRCVW